MTTLSSGTSVEVPFVCQHADALMIFGDGDRAAIAARVDEPRLQPIELATGTRGAAALWIMDYHATCLGPYREIVLTYLTAEELVRIADDPFAIAALALEPAARVYIAHLLLERAAVVPIDYGRELLHLDKRVVDRIAIDTTDGKKRWAVHVDGVEALAGEVVATPSFGERASGIMRFLQRAGLVRTARALGSSRVLGAAPQRMHGGGVIEAHLRGTPTVTEWHATDRLSFSAHATALTTELDAIGFRPRAVSRVPRCQFTMELKS